MPQSTSNTELPTKWALALRRERQVAIGQQLRVECDSPMELPGEVVAPLINSDKEDDPYADIVGTC